MTLSSLVTGPSHGLLAQSQKAHCPRATLNADGFGLSWYVPDISPIPAVYKEVSPAWSNHNLRQIARVTKSHCILAHVRAASTGAVTQTNCHPFSYRSLSFMHNGTVAYFSTIKRRMMGSVSQRAFEMIQGSTDSELIFAMFITNFERIANIKVSPKAAPTVADEPYDTAKDWTATLANAMKLTLTQVHRFVLDHESEMVAEEAAENEAATSVDDDDNFDGASMPTTRTVSRLNLCVTDGRSVVVSRYTTGTDDTAHTLYWSRGQRIECATTGECRVVKHEDQSGKSSPRTLAKDNGDGGDVGNVASLNYDGDIDGGMVVVSSEPLDKGYECAEVPPNHIVVAGPRQFSIQPVC